MTKQYQHSSELKLINQLTESRLFRTRQTMDALNVSDAGELAFAYLMQLNMMNKDYEFAIHWQKNMQVEQLHTEILIILEQVELIYMQHCIV